MRFLFILIILFLFILIILLLFSILTILISLVAQTIHRISQGGFDGL